MGLQGIGLIALPALLAHIFSKKYAAAGAGPLPAPRIFSGSGKKNRDFQRFQLFSLIFS
jgi:hypothetical protein